MIFGCVLDGNGGCKLISWDDAQGWQPSTPVETLWLHLDRVFPDLDDWLIEKLALSEATADVLISNETRPRAFKEADTLVAVMRGINFNPGSEPEDMIAMQLWSDGARLITLRRRKLQTPHEVRAELQAGNGPASCGDLFTELCERMVVKMNQAIVEMNERIDEMEEDRDSDIGDMLDEIADIRRDCLALKRYMSPQRDALLNVQRTPTSWMTERNLTDLRETGERLQRYLDDLDVSKESALVLQDDLNNRAAAKMNKTMYVLSIVAAIFLPLGFVTGLLGINVGGMPGVNSGSAFWITVGALALLMCAQFWIFRKLKWL